MAAGYPSAIFLSDHIEERVSLAAILSKCAVRVQAHSSQVGRPLIARLCQEGAAALSYVAELTCCGRRSDCS